MEYRTNDAGDQDLDGDTIRKTAEKILDSCEGNNGSYGTDNCDECHVTINYRDY